MGRARVEEEIAGSAADVWALVRDFGAIDRWNEGLTSCAVDGEGVGAVRTIKLGDVTIRERFEKIDEARKTLSYSIVEGPVPAKDYLATIEISASGPARTRIVWSSTFEPEGATDEQLQRMFESIYQQGIEGLRKTVNR
jgi:Polyketide cyclase / dehydrase and lipid transport